MGTTQNNQSLKHFITETLLFQKYYTILNVKYFWELQISFGINL